MSDEFNTLEHTMRGWLAEMGFAGDGLLLADWVEAARALCREGLPEVPIWQPPGYDAAGKFREAHISHYEPAFHRIWPAIWHHIPVGAHVFVRRVPADEFSKNRTIILPDSGKRPNHKGWVLNVSPTIDFPLTPNPLQLVGSMVSWGEYAGTPLVDHALDAKWDGEYLLLPATDILSIQTKGENYGTEEGDEEEAVSGWTAEGTQRRTGSEGTEAA